jgi:hypothetical protein
VLNHYPLCDTEYGSVSQHWAVTANCTSPPIPNRTQDFLARLRLDDASLNDLTGRPALPVGIVTRAVAAWPYDELEWELPR